MAWRSYRCFNRTWRQLHLTWRPGSKSSAEWCLMNGIVCTILYASKNLCVVWVPSNFVPMDFLITPRWWWPFGFWLEWKITTDFLVITWVPSQANDRSIVDMHQKLTANDERPWAEDGWGQCSTRRWVVMGTSTTLPRSSTANLLLVNLDISRQGLHQLAIQTAKDIEESPTPQIVAKWLWTGTWRLVTNRSKWIQHDSTGSIYKEVLNLMNIAKIMLKSSEINMWISVSIQWIIFMKLSMNICQNPMQCLSSQGDLRLNNRMQALQDKMDQEMQCLGVSRRDLERDLNIYITNVYT